MCEILRILQNMIFYFTYTRLQSSLHVLGFLGTACFICVTRSQWLELRNEYLSLQKANVAQLKSSLKALKQINTNQTAGIV